MQICLIIFILQMIIIPVCARETCYNFNTIRYNNNYNNAYSNGFGDGFETGYNEHVVKDIRYNVYGDDYIEVDYNEYSGMFFIDTKYDLGNESIKNLLIGFVCGICFLFAVCYFVADNK